MKKAFKYLIPLTVLVCAGCVDNVKLLNVASSGKVFASEDSFYVACSDNGNFKELEYPRHCAESVEVVRDAISKHGARVEASSRTVSKPDALACAKSKGLSHLVYIQILNWEERATRWSTVPGSLELQISIIECQSGKLGDSAIIVGEGSSIDIADAHLLDMLPKHVNKYISRLFKKN